jgi:hypothetical protein
MGACLDGTQWMGIVGGVAQAYALANRCLTKVEPGMVILPSLSPWVLESRGFRSDMRFHAFVTSRSLMEYYRQHGPPDDCNLKNSRLTCH